MPTPRRVQGRSRAAFPSTPPKRHPLLRRDHCEPRRHPASSAPPTLSVARSSRRLAGASSSCPRARHPSDLAALYRSFVPVVPDRRPVETGVVSHAFVRSTEVLHLNPRETAVVAKPSAVNTKAPSWGSHLLAGTGRSQSIGSPRCLVSPWCHLVRIVPLGPTHLPCWTSLPEPKSGSFTVQSSDVSGLLTSDPFATPREQAHPTGCHAWPLTDSMWFAPRFARHFEGALLFTKHPTALHLLEQALCDRGNLSLSTARRLPTECDSRPLPAHRQGKPCR